MLLLRIHYVVCFCHELLMLMDFLFFALIQIAIIPSLLPPPSPIPFSMTGVTYTSLVVYEYPFRVCGV